MRKFSFYAILITLLLFIGGCNSTTTDVSKTTDTSKSTQGSSGEKVEVSSVDKDAKSEEKQEIPFKIDDFVLTVTPTGEIDSAGGVGYYYEIKNNSPIPVQEMILNIKFEFENGQITVQNVPIRHTVMNGESSGDSYKVYPEPASNIKSYQLIGYQILDANGIQYLVDLQLEKTEVSKTNNGSVEATEDIPFKIDDFVLTVTPTGEIDSAGGVGYYYEIKNNSPIPVQEMILNIKFEFENGQITVQNVPIRHTVMNGESSGDSYKVYPEPASNIKSYQLIGYEIKDADDKVFKVDTQLKRVQNY